MDEIYNPGVEVFSVPRVDLPPREAVWYSDYQSLADESIQRGADLSHAYDRIAQLDEQFERARGILGTIADTDPAWKVPILKFLDRLTSSETEVKS